MGYIFTTFLHSLKCKKVPKPSHTRLVQTAADTIFDRPELGLCSQPASHALFIATFINAFQRIIYEHVINDTDAIKEMLKNIIYYIDVDCLFSDNVM